MNLNTFIHNKRCIYAWFLLLTICVQRVVGYIGTEISYTIEVKIEMNELEEAIADKILDQSGQDLEVQVLDEEQTDFLQGLGYGAPFILTDTIDNKECSYTIAYPPRTILVDCDTNSDQSEDEQPFNTSKSFNDKLYSPFFFWVVKLNDLSWEVLIINPHTLNRSLLNPFIPVLSPPPKLA